MTGDYRDGLRLATVTSAFDLPIMGRAWGLAGAADLCPLYVRHSELPTADRVSSPVGPSPGDNLRSRSAV
ncbi:MAG TPA: hypothetical protein VIL48_04965 [Acidimicrobiales bacterium]